MATATRPLRERRSLLHTRPGLRALVSTGVASVSVVLALLTAGCQGEGDARALSANEAAPAEGSVSTAGEAPEVGGSALARTEGRTSTSTSEQLEESRTTAIVQAAERIGPAVVAVNVIRTQRVRPRSLWEEFFLPPGAARRVPGLGSGFVIDPSGIIVTNDHVVRGAQEILVTLPDGRDLEAELVGADELTDVAVIRVAAGDLPTAVLGTSRDLRIGEWAVAVGNPFGSLISNPEPSVTAGVVSAMGRHIVPDQDGQGFYLAMIQTDAAVNPGNSGGPLVNALGEVVGMNASILSRHGGSEGVGFAIPIERVLRIADDLLQHGTVRRAWTGMNVEPVEADQFGRTRGVRVASVGSDSPAGEAGIRAGDRLLRANGTRLVTPLDFEAILLDLRVGEDLEVEVEGRDAPIRLTARTLPSLEAERVRVLEELVLVTLTPAIRAERGIASEHGALVTGISSRLASQLGLREGDVILQINQLPVQDADQVGRILGELADGSPVRIYFERNRGIGIRDFRMRR